MALRRAIITLAGLENAGNTFGSVAGVHDLPNPGTFIEDYAAAFDGAAPGAYSALAYACTQILLAALDTAIAGGAADPAAIREGVRAAVFSGAPVDTILGPLVVDPNGDSGTWLSFYKTDPAAEGGEGGWVFVKQENFAPSAPAESGAPARRPSPERPRSRPHPKHPRDIDGRGVNTPRPRHSRRVRDVTGSAGEAACSTSRPSRRSPHSSSTRSRSVASTP